jgi:translation initiation factor 2 gamma subunit (eIF-2gamma)
MIMDFTKTTYVQASSPEQAKEFAEERERNHQKTLTKNGYSIGDVDIIQVEECKHPNLKKKAEMVARMQNFVRQRERVYNGGN